jgi:hypothetical protein
MKKANWIKLTMPASITLLAISILTVPLLSTAQIRSWGSKTGPFYIRCMIDSCG